MRKHLCGGIGFHNDSIVVAQPSKANKWFGLGLLLVKDICKQFKCEFSILGNADAGYTVCIVFP